MKRIPQGWQFENSYLKLPDVFFAVETPAQSPNPSVELFNHALAAQLGLDFNAISMQQMADLFSGNHLPAGSEPIATAYAGHQFGHFNLLGDGRAHLLGEHITPEGVRVDVQFKGSGKTRFSRRGDGRAALGPMLREYVISEAMHALNIPTTRSLAVVRTGDTVFRQNPQPGAVLTRIAASHIRIGTFEFAAQITAQQEDTSPLTTLADYTLNRHYPHLINHDNRYLALLKAVMTQQIDLVIHWLRVGFIHGVMNTDNISLSGETIDYGPCAFMDRYDPNTVFSSIDHTGRYAFDNQSRIMLWNLCRFAETLLPLIDANADNAVQLVNDLLESYEHQFEQCWLEMMRKKLGLVDPHPDDRALIKQLLKLMQQHQLDYTNTFLKLTYQPTQPWNKADLGNKTDLDAWLQRWQQRVLVSGSLQKTSQSWMQQHNPVVIPRNHLVESALNAAETASDLAPMTQLLTILSEPYQHKPNLEPYQSPPTPDQRVYQTFCGT